MFEAVVRLAHRQLKTGFFRWLLTYRPQNLITGTIIYSMIELLADASEIVGAHVRYACFLSYGDAESYEKRLKAYRVNLGKMEQTDQPAD